MSSVVVFEAAPGAEGFVSLDVASCASSKDAALSNGPDSAAPPRRNTARISFAILG